MGIMTESKFRGMVLDLLGTGVSPCYRSGLFNALNCVGNPRSLKDAEFVADVDYAEGHAAGKELQTLFLGLDGRSEDEFVIAEICRIVKCDTERIPLAVLEKVSWEGNRRAQQAFNVLLGVAG